MRSLYLCTLLISTLMTNPVQSQNVVPVITNCSVVVDTAHKLCIIRYDIHDQEGDSMDIAVRLSANGGESFLLTPENAKGDVGFPVLSGSGKKIVFPYTAKNVRVISKYRVKLIADDRVVIDLHDLAASLDTAYLKNTLQEIYGIRNHATTQGVGRLNATRDLLTNTLKGSGLSVFRQDSIVDKLEVKNIIGKKTGCTAEDEVYILCAHYDTVEKSPGADDNASGIAGMLGAMKVLSAYNFRNTLLFIGFDQEEAGSYGSLLYVLDGGIRRYETVKGAINFDMIGYSSEKPNSQLVPEGFDRLFPEAYSKVAAGGFRGNFALNVSDENSLSIMHAFDRMSAKYVPSLNVISLVVKDKGGATSSLAESDHASFWASSLPAIHIGDGAASRNRAYHSKRDVLGTIDYAFMTKIVRASIVTLATLAEIRHCSEIVAGIGSIQ